MTIIPAEHRFAKVRRKLKLVFAKSIEPANDESPTPPTAA